MSPLNLDEPEIYWNNEHAIRLLTDLSEGHVELS